MAIPFTVFDGSRYDPDTNRAYCVRCEAWIEGVSSPFSGSLDPHIEDHVIVWMALNDLHRKNAT